MKLVPQVLCAAALCCVAGLASADPNKDESGHGRGRGSDRGGDKREWRDRGSYFHEHGYTRLHIPKGHYPPPGECRVWYPDRPAGHQPPPGKCGRIPPGAWLIRHPQDAPGHVHVTVYEPQRPGVVMVVGEFAIASGAFLRVVVGR